MSDDTNNAPAPAPSPAPSPAPAAPTPAPTPSPAPAAPSPAPAPAPTEPKAQTWPDTWRDLMAGDLDDKADDAVKAAHAKTMGALKRYNSPADVAKALRAAQVKLSDGSVKQALAKDATPEQLAEWRKENGIPESPDKYDLGLDKGVVLGDGDKALLDGWVAKVHGANASPEVVKAGAAALIELRDQQAAAFVEKDAGDKASFEDTLRAEWGADFRSNVQGIEVMLGQAGQDVKDAIAGARGPDGMGLANNPAVMRWLAAHAREMGFTPGTVVPAGGDMGKGMDDEIASLEKRMGDDQVAWRKDAKAQARYMELVNARDRLKKRAA